VELVSQGFHASPIRVRWKRQGRGGRTPCRSPRSPLGSRREGGPLHALTRGPCVVPLDPFPVSSSPTGRVAAGRWGHSLGLWATATKQAVLLRCPFSYTQRNAVPSSASEFPLQNFRPISRVNSQKGGGGWQNKDGPQIIHAAQSAHMFSFHPLPVSNQRGCGWVALTPSSMNSLSC